MLRILILAAALLIGGTGCSKNPSQAGAEATLPELNRAMQMWFMTQGSYPTDVNQLTNSPALKGKHLPAPPAGKKLALDPVAHEITYVDQ